MNSNQITRLKQGLKLTKLQREIVIGLLLGDGHLESRNKGKLYRLKIEYSERQKEYALWMWNLLKNWTHGEPYQRQKLSGVKIIGFTTYSHGAFRFYGQQFYSKEGRKRIPDIIRKLLTPRSIAIWFMDDGSWKSDHHRTYIIHADGYTKNDLERMQDVLEKKFDIETSLHRQYQNWRLYIKTKSAEKFKKLIEPYVIQSMKYKLGNK